MKKIGAFVGKFYPPHIGHIWVVDTLLPKLDEIYIIISKNEKRNRSLLKEQQFEIISAELIAHWFKEHYKKNPKVKVKIFNEGEFKPYPEDRDKWAEKFKKEFPTVNMKIADESYREYNNQYFKEYEFLPIPRDVVNIHSTEIRKNLKENFEYLIDEAKPYFKEKI